MASTRVSSEGGGGDGYKTRRHSNCEWEGGSCRDGLQLAFRAREVVVVGVNPFCHLNDKWEGGGAGQETPPTRVTSKGEGRRVQSVCECSGGKERTTRRG